MLVTNYAIKFRIAVYVFMAVLIVIGIAAYNALPREGFPDITIPQVFIRAPYEGTAPEEMENLVTIPLEKKLNELGNVKEITSTSAESFTTISVEFLPNQDIDMAIQRVKDKIDLARVDLPDDLEEPIVDGFNFSTDVPIMRFSLSGSSDIERLKNIAENLQDKIELMPGVREAGITGTREREIRIEFDRARLSAYEIPLADVLALVGKENVTISAGSLEVGDSKYQVRLPGEFKLAGEMRDLVVKVHKGRPIYLSDLATVTDTYKDTTSIARINGEPSVSISIKKRSGANTVALTDEIKAMLERYDLPKDIKLTIVQDESKRVRDMLAELENNIITGFLFVIIVLFVFMGGRNSLFVGLAIPLSMLLTYVIMYFSGITLNMVVLFGLILGCGNLVDNAVVIVENIYRLHCGGLSQEDAARRGTAEVAWPVTTSTLTSMIALAPLLFWPDIIGQFMQYIPLTLMITQGGSLLVALITNPAVCSVLIKKGRVNDNPLNGGKPHPFVGGYETFLRKALNHRVMVLLLSLSFLMLSTELYKRFNRGVELFPTTEPESAQIQVKYPQGTAIETTDAALHELEKILAPFKEIKFFQSNAGQGNASFDSTSSGTHIGSIYIDFVDEQLRETKASEVVEQIRAALPVLPGAEVTIEKDRRGPPAGAPISIEISGEDFDRLTELSGEIRQRIETIPGLTDLRSDFEDALPELQFDINRQRTAMLGLDTITVGTFLRTSIYGIESRKKFRAGEDEYDITVRLPKSGRDQFSTLGEIMIPVKDQKSVPLSSLGEFKYTAGLGEIKRKDLKRVITLMGNNEGRSVEEILKDVSKAISDVNLPNNYSVYYAGDNEDSKESMAFLSRAFLLAIAGILVILVIQFNSVLRPFIIGLSIPLSIIGVMWGLILTQTRASVIMTGLGIVSLAGIVVNNAIVLIDCINLQKKEGMGSLEAVVTAGRLRLRPVLLTAGTTVLGLIPMAVGWNIDVHSFPFKVSAGGGTTAWWAPMAVAMIFGLSVSTLLTLVYVPVMYSLADSLVERLRKLIRTKE
jgi:multidrug efflux pump subunit AcrB